MDYIDTPSVDNGDTVAVPKRQDPQVLHSLKAGHWLQPRPHRNFGGSPSILGFLWRETRAG